MEEIEVVVGPQGESAFDMEMQRQAALQEAIFAEARMRERREEELAWRQADPDLEEKEPRRRRVKRRSDDSDQLAWDSDDAEPTQAGLGVVGKITLGVGSVALAVAMVLVFLNSRAGRTRTDDE